MNDYMKCEDAERKIKNIYCDNCQRDKNMCRVCAVDDFFRVLEQTPAVDVEPVRHGHWIKERYGNKDCLTCSVCGMTRNYLNQFEYCPHCGTRMDGKEQEHENNNSL